jgi:hypothetical protein
MKHVPDHAQQPERPRSLEELRCRLNRRLSDFRDGWRRCDNPSCRRWKQCCGEGPDFKCTDDGRPRLTRSPEERAKVISDLYKEVKKRRAAFAAGAEPPDPETLRELRDKARAAALRRLRSARAGRAMPAADAPQAHETDTPAPVAEGTQLAPEKLERINRAWNDYVASLPAEPDRARERGPRITQL